MATLIDPYSTPDEDKEQEFSSVTEEAAQGDEAPEEATETEEVQETEQGATQTEDDLPAKYKGKTAAEIARMHIEAEKLIGRQAQEVGEVRKLADELIKKSLVDTPKKEAAVEKEEEEVDFFSDPDKAVSKKIKEAPELQEARQFMAEMKKQKFVQDLRTKHPNFEQTVMSPEFAEWVKSSKVRLELFSRADGLDMDAADELLSTWKYVSNKPAENPAAKAAVKEETKKAVAKASVDSGAASGAPVSNKVYRKVDIMRLRLEDPDRYYDPTVQAEIVKAYREGRVR